MSSYQIDWIKLVDQRLVDDLSAATGAGSVLMDDARPAITRILKACGGWPYVTKVPSHGQVRSHVRRLLGEAFSHALGSGAAAPPGFDLVKRTGKPAEIQVVERVLINFADEQKLMSLPEITSSTAGRIVAEREERGPYRDADDLYRRLPRLGKQRIQALSPRLSYRKDPAPLIFASGDWKLDLATLASLQTGSDTNVRLLNALRCAAEHAEASPHPHRKSRLSRSFAGSKPPRGYHTDESVVLSGRRYHAYLQDAFRAATTSIDVLMFHIAMPTEDHPTKRLLSALDQAHQRGVRVRVLVDQDRRDDPYNSRAINAAAIRFLTEKGIAVRVDRPSRLLHSKMLVIDESETIIGSHNWSAGSYFSFDDLTVAIRSVEFAKKTVSRFKSLWSKARQAPSD